MNTATSLPRLMSLTLAFAAGAGATYWLTKSSEQASASKPKPAQAEPERAAQVSAAAPLPPRQTADSRSPGEAARDFLSSSVPSRHVLEREGWDLAGVGIETAMSRMAQIKDLYQRSAFITGMFEQLALSQKPADLLVLMKRLPDGLDRETAMAALMRSWRRTPNVLTVSNELGIAGSLGLYLLKTSKNVTPQEVAAFTRDFVKGNARGTLLAEIAAKLAQTDPVAAFALGDELAGQQQMNFMHRFAAGWAAHDATAALKWAEQVPDEVTRAELQARIIETEAEKNPASAAHHAWELPENTAGRMDSLQAVAREWAARDTRAALLWAEGLAHEAEKAAAQAGIRASAPVGIGAVLSTEQGLPVIANLMNGGAAQRSGTLQKGDRILAVSDAVGRWVGASQVNLADVVGLIRGEAGSAVSLRIQPAAGGAARVITITRQQIINTPDKVVH